MQLLFVCLFRCFGKVLGWVFFVLTMATGPWEGWGRDVRPSERQNAIAVRWRSHGRRSVAPRCRVRRAPTRVRRTGREIDFEGQKRECS